MIEKQSKSTMSHNVIDSKIEEELSEEKQAIYERLATIFDPETAISYVCPKTVDMRDDATLEDLKKLNFHEQKECLQRLRESVRYRTITQPLSRTDLEAAYQTFVRDQVAQQTSRHEMEQFVRSSSDIDSAKRYLHMANDVLVNPHQSQLLFRSSKLNEQKAHLLKSSGYSNRLQQLNEDPSIDKYFPHIHAHPSRDPVEDEDDFFVDKQNLSRSRSMHLEHNEKKYHVQFLKDYDAHNPIYRTASHRQPLPTGRLTQHNLETLFANENSPSQGRPTEPSVRRDPFPPLTISALKEYRPTFSAKPKSFQRKSSAAYLLSQRKPMRRADFLWNQSVVSSKKPK